MAAAPAFLARCRARLDHTIDLRERGPILIRDAEAKAVADELHVRYEHARAVTLIGRLLQKALFGGRPDEVVFWALVFAHYCGGDLNSSTERQLGEFAPFILRDPPTSN